MLVFVAIAIAGFVFGAEAARGEIVSQIQGLVGREGARAVQAMLQGAAKRSSGIVATIVGLVTLVVGATGVFSAAVDGNALSFERTSEGFRDRETRSTWNLLGYAVQGPLAGKRLREFVERFEQHGGGVVSLLQALLYDDFDLFRQFPRVQNGVAHEVGLNVKRRL